MDIFCNETTQFIQKNSKQTSANDSVDGSLIMQPSLLSPSRIKESFVPARLSSFSSFSLRGWPLHGKGLLDVYTVAEVYCSTVFSVLQFGALAWKGS